MALFTSDAHKTNICKMNQQWNCVTNSLLKQAKQIQWMKIAMENNRKKMFVFTSRTERLYRKMNFLPHHYNLLPVQWSRFHVYFYLLEQKVKEIYNFLYIREKYKQFRFYAEGNLNFSNVSGTSRKKMYFKEIACSDLICIRGKGKFSGCPFLRQI